jgi:uncharacterized phage protein gp47/JayE
MAGVTAEGLEIKTLETILAEINSECLNTISPTLDLSPDSNFGQINAIHAKQLATLWEGLQVAYNAFNRGSAEGTLLENIGKLTGTAKRAATKSRVILLVQMTAGTALVAGSAKVNHNTRPNVIFALKQGSGTVTGESAGTGTWSGSTFTAANDDVFQLLFESVDDGPVQASAGYLATINTPVSGWISVTNAADAIPGKPEETDSEYRLRQQDELSAPGSCTVDAIRADVLNVTGVEQVTVTENTSEYALLVPAIPPKSFRVLLYDGAIPAADDDAIAQAIWNDKPAGITPVGMHSGTAVDSLGTDRTVAFTRATQVRIVITIELAIDPKTFPSDGADQIKTKIAAKGNTLKMGQDVVALVYKATAFDVQGVKDINDYTQAIYLGTPADVNILIPEFEIARFSTLDITVTTVEFVDA